MEKKMNITPSIQQQLQEIINEKAIYPVYQPIVSLKDGKIFGYEALSRISLKSCSFNIEEMFDYAKEMQCLWELEYICRKKALKEIKDDIGREKLFLNVDPNIFNDERFQVGMTLSYLKRYNISPENVIFEICERTDIDKIELFQNAVNHYKKQNYQIAIDDFGKDYANFNRIFFLHPMYVKLDISLVKNINNDSVKSSLVEGLVKFCHSENICLIAEGIETKEELLQLIRLGVDYGQGYYLGKPDRKLQKLPNSIGKLIISENQTATVSEEIPSFFGNVGAICQRIGTTTCDTKAIAVFEFMKRQPEITEICVVDNNQKVCGLLTKQFLDKHLGGRYGYSLYSKDMVGNLLSHNYLEVDYRMPIEMVSRLALIRPKQVLYDAIVVSDNGTYVGIVTVKDLLEASISIQVERAMDTNPLTHLPGNIQIQDKISSLLFSGEKYSIMYLDLDNFKSYNDVYGFENGDTMLRAVAKCMQDACRNREFIGHIGGDDFVIISHDYNLEEVFRQIIEKFHICLADLYTEEDYAQGCIHSQNRRGEPEIFPLASISGALYTNEKLQAQSMNDFSYQIALTKKACKKHVGDYLQKTEDILAFPGKGH